MWCASGRAGQWVLARLPLQNLDFQPKDFNVSLDENLSSGKRILRCVAERTVSQENGGNTRARMTWESGISTELKAFSSSCETSEALTGKVGSTVF